MLGLFTGWIGKLASAVSIIFGAAKGPMWKIPKSRDINSNAINASRLLPSEDVPLVFFGGFWLRSLCGCGGVDKRDLIPKGPDNM